MLDPTYDILKQIAAENHRSINSEIIYLIEKATKSTKIDPNQHLVLSRKLREKSNRIIIDNAMLMD